MASQSTPSEGTKSTPEARSERKPVLLHFRSSKKFIVFVVFLMSFTDTFLYGVIIPVVPRALNERVGIPYSQVQAWTSILLTTYGLALLVCSPIFGYLADRMKSRQTPLLAGLILLAASTVMLCVGTSTALWVMGRALQGASCAVVWIVGLALLTDSVDEDEIGKYLGIVSLAFTAGTLTGPLLGGVVYDHGGYYAVFGMAFALIGVDIILRLVMIERKTLQVWDQDVPNDDSERQVLNPSSSGGHESLSTPGIHPQNIEPSSEPLNGEQGLTAKQGKRSAIPPVISLLGSARLLAALWASLIFAVVVSGFDSTLPIFVRETFKWSSTGGGLIFLAVFVPTLIGPWVGLLTDRHGPKYYVAGGLLLMTPFYICLRFIKNPSIEHEVLLCVLLFMIGLGSALVSTPIYTEIIHVVLEKERANPGMFGERGASAQAYGLMNFAIAAGILVGPIYAGFIKDRFSWGTMGWALGLLMGLSSIPALIFTGGRLGRKKGGELGT